jgi:hypothetical protein
VRRLGQTRKQTRPTRSSSEDQDDSEPPAMPGPLSSPSDSDRDRAQACELPLSHWLFRRVRSAAARLLSQCRPAVASESGPRAAVTVRVTAGGQGSRSWSSFVVLPWVRVFHIFKPRFITLNMGVQVSSLSHRPSHGPRTNLPVNKLDMNDTSS